MATLEQCELALDLYENRLGQLRNVVGLGIVPASELGDDENLAVAVYVSRKVPASELRPEDLVPSRLEIAETGIAGPGDLGKVPTRVIEQGEVSLEGL